MCISEEKTKEIQTAFEQLMESATADERKNLAAIIPSLLYELNRKDETSTTHVDENMRPNGIRNLNLRELARIIASMSSLEVPEVFDEVYLKELGALANNLDELIAAMSILSKLLERRNIEILTKKMPLSPISQ